jgi:hypothetical protein
MKAWIKKGCFVCAGAAALGLLVLLTIGGLFLVQHLSVEPEPRRLAQELPPVPLDAPPGPPGRVVLSLSSAAVTVEAGPSGEPIRVESDFDPDVHRMEQSYEEDGAGGWVYRLDFHEKRLLHVSVVGVWLGKRSPEVRIVLPRDLPFALEAKMEGGYLILDLAGLALTTVDVESDRGVLGVDVSEPLTTPLERMAVKGRIGTMFLSSLGNASPGELRVRHGIGAAWVDLGGAWRADADVEFRVTLGNGELRLPRDVRIEGLDRGIRPPGGVEEIPRRTLRVTTHYDMGDIQVVD